MTTNDIQPNDLFDYDGRRVMVIAVDPDPTADVWVVDYLDPDISLFVPRVDLTPVPE